MLKEELIYKTIELGKKHKEVAANDDPIEYYDFIQGKLDKGIGLYEAKEQYNKKILSIAIEKLKEKQR